MLRHHHGLMGHVLSIFPYKRSFSGDKHRSSSPRQDEVSGAAKVCATLIYN